MQWRGAHLLKAHDALLFVERTAAALEMLCEVRLPRVDGLHEALELHLLGVDQPAVLLLEGMLLATPALLAEIAPRLPGALRSSGDYGRQHVARRELLQVVVELLGELGLQVLLVKDADLPGDGHFDVAIEWRSSRPTGNGPQEDWPPLVTALQEPREVLGPEDPATAT